MNKNLVSIIMPAFNSSSTIGKSIESVINQDYKNWELIIADDDSKDNTKEIIEFYSKKDNRIIPIYSKKNGGPAKSRNLAIEKASGNFIAFLDSDDIWIESKLRKTLNLAENNKDVCIFYTGFRRISSDGNKVGSYIGVPEEITYKKLLGGNIIATSTVLIRKELFPNIYMKDTYYDDFDCWLRILKKTGIGIGLDEDLMRYSVLDNSISRNKLYSAVQVWKAYRNLEKLNLLESFKYFTLYTIAGLIKYRKF